MKPWSRPSAMLCASARACWNFLVILSMRIGLLLGLSCAAGSGKREAAVVRLPTVSFCRWGRTARIQVAFGSGLGQARGFHLAIRAPCRAIIAAVLRPPDGTCAAIDESALFASTRALFAATARRQTRTGELPARRGHRALGVHRHPQAPVR